MKVIDNVQSFRAHFSRCVATIGKFDGVHIGHQAILRQLREKAAEYEVPAVAVVIEPHPEEYFAASPQDCPARLSEAEEKISLLAQQGVDIVYKLRFDKALSRLSAEAYIEQILVEGLGVRCLIAGQDFRFGYQRRGDFSLLQTYGRRYDFEVIETASCEYEGVRVSSTYVREQLMLANFARVEALLGRPYAISGKVVKGRQLGRDLGFPTCNVRLNRLNIPLHGVYACEAVLRTTQGESWTLAGAANIGYRPTVSDERKAVLEVHLLDFEQQVYDAAITVIFRHRIRPEEKFESLEQLQKQIAADVQQARDFFATHLLSGVPASHNVAAPHNNRS